MLCQSCILFQLLRFLHGCFAKNGDNRAVFAEKMLATDLVHRKVMPLVPLLLRSFDPATMDAVTGNNALHEMCSLFTLEHEEDWPNKFFQLLIDHGVSVHARNHERRTLLLQSAAFAGSLNLSADGLRLFLRNGFDLNAQDAYGNGVLHFLVAHSSWHVLMDLLDGDGTDDLDHSLRNSDGHTAADLAAIILAELQHDAENAPAQEAQQLLETQTRAWEIRLLLLSYTSMWEQRVRPLLLHSVEAVLPVADVAKLAMGYVDGSGPPFATAAEAEADEQAEPAAGAHAAAAEQP